MHALTAPWKVLHGTVGLEIVNGACPIRVYASGLEARRGDQL
jgi:hypothetical protein